MKYIVALCYRFTAFWMILMCAEATVNHPQNFTVGISILAAVLVSILQTLANIAERSEKI